MCKNRSLRARVAGNGLANVRKDSHSFTHPITPKDASSNLVGSEPASGKMGTFECPFNLSLMAPFDLTDAVAALPHFPSVSTLKGGHRNPVPTTARAARAKENHEGKEVVRLADEVRHRDAHAAPLTADDVGRPGRNFLVPRPARLRGVGLALPGPGLLVVGDVVSHRRRHALVDEPHARGQLRAAEAEGKLFRGRRDARRLHHRLDAQLRVGGHAARQQRRRRRRH